MQYNFKWDPNKAKSNVRKHGISFEEASNIFKDPLMLTLFDESHSERDKERWITLGKINFSKYVVVSHAYLDEESNTITIRIISARPASKAETRQYEEYQ